MSKSKTTKTKPAKSTKAKSKTKEPKGEKLSAIDAAAQVLASSKEPMNAKELIEAMAAKGLWTSPGGRTPHATLYSALIREIALKGKDSRFVKTERGKFAAK
jgi:HB1, ASXL, restriction endonuclease HTH domain